jgi:DNA-binding MarR family transcriptional regulator
MSAHVRMASAMTTLFDRMDEDTTEAWDSLTGLQVLLMRVIATEGRTDRTSLALVARTSRAAAVPSLNSLIRKGMVAEIPDDHGAYLVLDSIGRRMLSEVQNARAAWLLRAADEATPPVSAADLDRSAALMEHLDPSADRCLGRGATGGAGAEELTATWGDVAVSSSLRSSSGRHAVARGGRRLIVRGNRMRAGTRSVCPGKHYA